MITDNKLRQQHTHLPDHFLISYHTYPKQAHPLIRITHSKSATQISTKNAWNLTVQASNRIWSWLWSCTGSE